MGLSLRIFLLLFPLILAVSIIAYGYEIPNKNAQTIGTSNTGGLDNKITAATHINVQHPWASKFAINLSELHPELSRGIKGTVVYSETLSENILHNIDNGTLYFFFPAIEVFLTDTYGRDFHYTYLKSDLNSACFSAFPSCRNNPSTNCSPDGIRNTVGFSNCSIHPLLFEGKTSSGKDFKVEILIGNSTWNPPFSRECVGRRFALDCSAKLTLNMNPYNVITSNNTWRVKISPKPKQFIRHEKFFISFSHSRGFGRHRLLLHDLIEYDNNTGELYLIDEGIDLLFALWNHEPPPADDIYYDMGTPYVEGEIMGEYVAEDGENYSFGHGFIVNLGKCTVKNSGTESLEMSPTDMVVLTCGGLGQRSSRAAPDGRFIFEGVPANCAVGVKLVRLDGRNDMNIPFDIKCLDAAGS
jgi:hypothetical protein